MERYLLHLQISTDLSRTLVRSFDIGDRETIECLFVKGLALQQLLLIKLLYQST